MVVNLYKNKYDVYIGRPGKGQAGTLGNPVRIGYKCPECSEVHSDGGNTLPCYERWLRRRITTDHKYKEQVKNLHGKVLGCFCKPNPCHGDVLVRVAEELNR